MSLRRVLFSAPTIPALLGFLFCLWNSIAPEAMPCGTTGCALYGPGTESNFLWHAGTAAFAVLAGLSALQRKSAANLALFFVACDIPLLFSLVLTAVCAKCLIVGALFFWTACAADRQTTPVREKSFTHRAIPALWLALFIMNLGSVLSDFIPSWSMSGNPRKAELVAYVSPTSPASLMAIKRYEKQGDKVAFLPIIKDGTDFSRIVYARMLVEENPERPLSQIMAAAGSPDYARPSVAVLVSKLPILLRCLINTARSLASGSRAVPIVEYRGLPPEQPAVH